MKDFKNLIYEDDICISVAKIREIKPTIECFSAFANRTQEKRKFKNVLIFGNDSILNSDAISVWNALKSKKLCSEVTTDFDTAKTSSLDNTVSFIYIDCTTISNPDKWLIDIENLFKSQSTSKKSYTIITIALPHLSNLPNGITALAEREYDFLLENKENKTQQEVFLLKLQSLCRKYVRDFSCKISVLRVLNIINAKEESTPENILDFIRSSLDKKEVSLENSSFEKHFSLTYSFDAVIASYAAFINGTFGNVYNYHTLSTTISELGIELNKLLPEHASLKINRDTSSTSTYSVLSTNKFSYINKFTDPKLPPETYTLNEIVRRIACTHLNITFPATNNLEIYSGKLDRIKELELYMLKEVDKICERHNLKYFIAAGSLLGAKRYGHNIPWDDDLDIAFLRDDFEKFRRVVEKELPSDIQYCCYYNETNSHYPVDKIRIKDTYFSTRFSSINQMPDGIFLDVLVYDATSDIAPIAWAHNKSLGIFMFFLLQILWRKPHRKRFSCFPAYLLYRFLNLLPLKAWHFLFELDLKFFRFKKHPRFLVDGTGARAGIKKIPAAGLFDTTRIPFDDGFMAPSPKDPEDYLIFAYGKNYLKEPNLSSQSGHALARIDLGNRLFKELEHKPFRKIDNRGELFEKELD